MDRTTLPRALTSAAMQTHSNIEIVVVSACGNDHRPLPSAWNERPLLFVQNGVHLERAAAANAALEAATGEWLNFLDDDDELLPDHVQILLARYADGLRSRLIYSRTLVVDLEGKTMSFGWNHQPIDLLEHSRFHLQAAIFHRSLIELGVRFDAALPVHEDLDFWIQCAQHTDFSYVDQYTYRWHAFIGTSGAGGGANLNHKLVASVQHRVQAKWAHLVPKWAKALEHPLIIERGRSALKMGNTVLARAFLEYALERAPTDANALNLAGMANLSLGNAARAVELISRATEIVPNHPGLMKNLLLAEEAAAKPTPPES
jgi:glycosyltransferase involved in cell wall biosynthesis